jgi:hypothetical protein
LVIFIIYLAFNVPSLNPKIETKPGSGTSSLDTNVFAEAIQVDSMLETVECVKLLQMTRKRLLKVSTSAAGEYISKLLVSHHFMQNILNILESCPYHEDDRYKTALELLVLILCESSSQSEYFQSTAVIDDLKRLLRCFEALADYKDQQSRTVLADASTISNIPEARMQDEKLYLAALRSLAAITINCPDFRDYLSSRNALATSLRLSSHATGAFETFTKEKVTTTISHNPAIVLWTMRFIAVMTLDHAENQAAFYYANGLSIIQTILDNFKEEREITRYTLLALLNLLNTPSSDQYSYHLSNSRQSSYSVAQARQNCLLLGLAETIIHCESARFPDDRDIVQSARRIGQLLYSNYS